MKPEAILQPENHTKKYDALFMDIDQGRIKIPQFQRDFVWDKEQTGKLVDSILKGFLLGRLFFGKHATNCEAFATLAILRYLQRQKVISLSMS
jgi:hypothetical protein